jgi:8-hydroxy-5-deazaflavin:NADPH oxidoreductase
MTTIGIIGSGMIGGTVARLSVAAGYHAESWRQEPETPAYGTPYGPFSDEAGTPASAARIHADLVGAHR